MSAIPATIVITDTTSGKSVSMPFQWDTEIGEYQWCEGNYSCDCNRGRFFHRSLGIQENQIHTIVMCGESRYFVRAKDDHGTVLYEDDLYSEVHP